jgi:biotin carboxyl carrier protein
MKSLRVDGLPVEAELVVEGEALFLQTPEKRVPLTMERHPNGSYTLGMEDQRYNVRVIGGEAWIDGRCRVVAPVVKSAGRLQVAASVRSGTPPGTPPMPGVVTRLLVEEGSRVEAGDIFAAITAMKMEHSLRAPVAGRVRRVLVAVGAAVKAGQVLVEWEEG